MDASLTETSFQTPDILSNWLDDQVWTALTNYDALFEYTLDYLSTAIQSFKALGDQAEEIYLKSKGTKKRHLTPTQIEVYHFLYVETFALKDALIYLRDLSVEIKNARIALSENVIDEDTFTEFAQNAKAYFTQVINDTNDIVYSPTKTDDTTYWYPEWRLQISPWQQLSVQLDTLLAQADQLRKDLPIELAISKELSELTTLTADLFEAYLQDKQSLTQQTEVLLNELSNVELPWVPSSYLNYLKKIEHILEEKPQSIYLDNYSYELNNKINDLPEEHRLVIDFNGGLLIKRTLEVRRKVRTWVDGEILPIATEVMELFRDSERQFSITLLNLKNRLALLANEKQVIEDIKSLENSLNELLRRFEADQQTIMTYQQDVMSRMYDAGHLTQVISGQSDILPEYYPSGFQGLADRQKVVVQWYDRLGNWAREHGRRLLGLATINRQISLSERVVRTVHSRKALEKQSAYHNIFSSKGYISDSFCVGLEPQINRVSKIIKHWREGYRGHIIITGRRFSGRTLFGEYLMHRFPDENYINLYPGKSVIISGRKIQLGYQLTPALKAISSHIGIQKYIIWIDDLELWMSHEVTIGDNLRALLAFMEREANRVLVVASTTNWVQQRLNTQYDFDKYWQADINLDRFTKHDIAEAILIRHGAAHRKLVNDQGKQLSANQFAQAMNKVSRFARGNIGEALQIWANSVRVIGDDDVVFDENHYSSLPDIVTKETAPILASVLLSKSTTEYRLSQQFGALYKDHYHTIVNRLYLLQVLQRGLDGKVSINESIVNDITHQLDQGGYIQAY